MQALVRPGGAAAVLAYASASAYSPNTTYSNPFLPLACRALAEQQQPFELSSSSGSSSSSKSPADVHASYSWQPEQQDEDASIYAEVQEPSELKSIISVFHPWSLLGILARSVGFSCLLRINVYVLELLDHEQSVIDAEARGEEPAPAPPFPPLWGQVGVGVRAGVREVGVRLMRRVYEHLAVWRLGYARAEPLLRDGVAWVQRVLAPKHAAAARGARLVRFGAALAHANALLYAADCTVAVGLMTHSIMRAQQCSAFRGAPTKRSGRQKVADIALGTGFHVARCMVLLAATSAVASAASLAKPGFGTRAGWFVSELFANQSMFILARTLSLPC